MVQRRVSSITWRQVASAEIEVGYDNGDAETVPGTHAEAGRMAQTAGLAMVRSPLGTVRWEPAHAEGPTRPSAGTRPTAPAQPPPPADEPPAAERGEHGQPSPRRSGTAEDDAPRPKRIGPWLSQ